MQWDDSYRYFPKHDENGRVQSSHHYFDTTDEVETLAAANRRLYGAPPTTSLFASMVPSLGSIIRCTGWVVLVVFIDFVLGVFLDGLSGRGGGDRRWGPLVRAIFKAIAPEGRAPRVQTGTPQTPRPKDVSTRYSSPVRPNRPHIDVPQREGSMVRSTADKPVNAPQQPVPPVGRAGANNTNNDEDAAPGLQWLLAAAITLLRGLGWVVLWLLSVAISMIPRPKKRRGWSAVDQVQRRVDAALGLLTPPTQEELLRRELGRMLQQSDVEGAYTNNTPRGAHHRPEMMSRVVALSHNMLELQRMEACKDGKLLSPSSSQRVGVPAHMQFGGRSNNHHHAATSPSDSSLKEVYELWDRLLDKGQAMAAPYTAGTSCLPTAKDSTANNEALLRELLLQMGHRPHGGAPSSAHGSSLWGRGGVKPHSVHYGKDSGSPPRLSRLLSEARGEHNKLSAMFALDGNAHAQSNNTNHPSGRGVVLGEVEAQLLSMVAGGRPQMPHRGTILGPLNPAPVMQQPNVNPFDCPPQQPMQQPMQPPMQQQQGQWGAAPLQQAQQGPWGQQQQAPQQQQVQSGGFPQQQQPLPFGQQQNNNNQFQGNMQQQNGTNGAAGGGMGGVFAGGGNNNFNNQQQNAFSTNTNNNNVFSNNTGACNAFAQGGNTNNGFPANNNNNNNNNNNFNNNFGSNNNQNNGASNNALWGNNNNNNNNNNNGGSQQQNGGFGSNNQNNNNGFDQSAATSKVLFDDEPVMGRGTVNENSNNCPFSALSPETAASCNRFQRPPTTSPPVNSGFGGNTFAAGPRRAPAPCRSMDEVPVGEVTKARGGIAINVDMGPSVGPNSRPPLRSSRLATPAKPSGTLPSRLQANMERRQQELAEKKLERQSGTTRNSAFAHDRVSTPADACADWNQRSRGPGRPVGSAVNFDDMPVGGRR